MKVFCCFVMLFGLILCTNVLAVESQYTLSYFVKPQHAKGMITFVKKLNDDFMVFFNHRGQGELWKINSEPEFITNLTTYQQSLDFHDAFLCKDFHGNIGLLVYVKNKGFLYFFPKVTTEKYSEKKTEFSFSFELKQSRDGQIFIWDLSNNETFLLTIDEKATIKPTYVSKQNLPDFNPQEDIKNFQMLLVGDNGLRGHFDSLDIFQVEEKLVRCYHQISGEIIVCGYNNLVSIWKRIN